MLIHDISTDTDNPPPFVALLTLRLQSANGAAYGGAAVAAEQRARYPDVQPLLLDAPPTVVFAKALQAAQDMGWHIAAAIANEGRIEATATTRWLRFKDDVIIRILARGTGSRLDIRSMSRIGRSDFGANAKRIRAFLSSIKILL